MVVESFYVSSLEGMDRPQEPKATQGQSIAEN